MKHVSLQRLLLTVLAQTSRTNAAKVRPAPRHGSMRDFDADEVARYEALNWVYYYQKRWPQLFAASTGMLRNAFGLSWLNTLRAAYWVTRAEIAAAPKDNDITLAEAYMRKFYRMVRRLQKEPIDVPKVATLEVRWWVVHRELAISRAEDKRPLEDALTELYAALYRAEPAKVREAAYYRALAMVYSDQWVEQGRADGHALLAEIRTALRKSYRSLRDAVNHKPGISID